MEKLIELIFTHIVSIKTPSEFIIAIVICLVCFIGFLIFKNFKFLVRIFTIDINKVIKIVLDAKRHAIDIRTIYNIETESNIEINIQNCTLKIDSWFNNCILNSVENKEILVYKVKSLQSTLAIIEYEFKSEYTNSLKNNGFMKLNEAEFCNYINRKQMIFEKIIKAAFRDFYIHQTDLDMLFGLEGASVEFNQMTNYLNKEISDTFFYIRNRVINLKSKIEDIKTELIEQLKTINIKRPDIESF